MVTKHAHVNFAGKYINQKLIYICNRFLLVQIPLERDESLYSR